MKEELSNLATKWSQQMLHIQEGPISTSASRPQISGILLSLSPFKDKSDCCLYYPTITCTF